VLTNLAVKQRVNISLDDTYVSNMKMVENGEKFKCNSCKKFVYIENLSNNNKIKICTRCASLHARNKKMSLDRVDELSHKERLDIRDRERSMSCSEKSERALSEQDMITAFLAKGKS